MSSPRPRLTGSAFLSLCLAAALAACDGSSTRGEGIGDSRTPSLPDAGLQAHGRPEPDAAGPPMGASGPTVVFREIHLGQLGSEGIDVAVADGLWGQSGNPKDLDGDGDDDVVLATKGGQVFKLPGQDASLPIAEQIFTGRGAYSTAGVFIGVDDLALARWYKGDWVRLRKSAGGWSQSSISVPEAEVPAAATGFGKWHDAAGFVDPVTGRTTVVLRHETWPPSETYASPTALFQLRDGSWVHSIIDDTVRGAGLGIGDVDGDGRPDILVGGGAWFRNPGDVFATWSKHRYAQDIGHDHALAIADVDEDGDADLVVTHSEIVSTGLAWFENPGDLKVDPDPLWVEHVVDAASPRSHGLVADDLNGDGHVDLYVVSFGQSGQQGGFVHHGDGEGGFHDKTQITDKAAHNSVSADLNNDGLPELIIKRHFDNDVWILENRTPVVSPVLPRSR
jgi:hypothetical protein